ncbi:MAG: hypothetical protein KC431_14755 [Myxococcales bacterium]|nr:hypothetical protein [Myxococcales bacterium]
MAFAELHRILRRAPQLMGLLLLVIGLVAPALARAEEQAPAQPAKVHEIGHEGGSCGETVARESVECAPRGRGGVDEPALVTLLRAAGLRASEEQCSDFLADIWDQQICRAQARDCGDYLPGGFPPPAPKLSTSSSSAHDQLQRLGLAGAGSVGLEPPGDEHLPKPFDLSPPEPPPRLLDR